MVKYRYHKGTHKHTHNYMRLDVYIFKYIRTEQYLLHLAGLMTRRLAGAGRFAVKSGEFGPLLLKPENLFASVPRGKAAGS